MIQWYNENKSKFKRLKYSLKRFEFWLYKLKKIQAAKSPRPPARILFIHAFVLNTVANALVTKTRPTKFSNPRFPNTKPMTTARKPAAAPPRTVREMVCSKSRDLENDQFFIFMSWIVGKLILIVFAITAVS